MMRKVLGVIVVFLVVALIIFFVQRNEGDSNTVDCGCPSCPCVTCGDKACSPDEACCEDCGCAKGSYCNTASHECVVQRRAFCGNGFCDPGENTTCCKDCSCKDTMVCNQKSNLCTVRGSARICGDGVCDYGESVRTCCEDCAYCETNEFCDKSTHTCKLGNITLKKDEAINLAKLELLKIGEKSDWLAGQDWQATVDSFEGQLVMSVCNPAASIGEVICVKVSEDKDIVQVVRFY